MERDIKRVIHIGYPKTATTTLQNHLFSKHSQISYPGKPYKDNQLKLLISQLVLKESTVFSPNLFKEYLQKNYWEQQGDSKNIFLISDETFVSAAKVRDKGVIAQRLKDIFYPCQILITLRNQLDAVKSGYINSGRFLGNVPPRFKNKVITFGEWLEINKKMYHGDFVRNAIYYDAINFYSQLFGKENIYILLFEEFVNKKRQFIEKLANFLKIDFEMSWEIIQNAHDNKRISEADFHLELIGSKIGMMKVFNPLIKALYKVKQRWNSKDFNQYSDIIFPGDWYQRLWDMYKEGNQKLIDDFQLPLEQYGYPL